MLKTTFIYFGGCINLNSSLALRWLQFHFLGSMVAFCYPDLNPVPASFLKSMPEALRDIFKKKGQKSQTKASSHNPTVTVLCCTTTSALASSSPEQLAGNKMKKMSVFLVLLITVVSPAIAPLPSQALNHLLKSKTFLSPPFFLRPGSVSNKWNYDIEFPRGHLAIKSFDGEVVDENGVPVPLHETYLHHWVVEPYYAAKNDDIADAQKLPKMIPARNSGVCTDTLGHYYGLGSESRRTAAWVPDPYGVEVGVPPEGYEERWRINVHAIDTRGVADKLGCTECRCDLYNVTVDEYGRGIGKDYTGGLYCCYDQTQCKVKEGLVTGGGEPRKLFFRYTVTWLDWSDAVVPVRIYILDVTDRALLEGKSEPACKVEYQVEECSSENRARNDCVDVQVTKQVLPRGGDIVFAVAHQHAGGIGSSLHGQDGQLLCASVPTYGNGQEAGNEAGYVVGMSACYPKPGTVTVRDGEALTIVSNYSSERQHAGVMGHFHILVAEQEQQQPATPNKPSLCFSFPVAWCLPAWLPIEQPVKDAKNMFGA